MVELPTIVENVVATPAYVSESQAAYKSEGSSRGAQRSEGQERERERVRWCKGTKEGGVHIVVNYSRRAYQDIPCVFLGYPGYLAKNKQKTRIKMKS